MTGPVLVRLSGDRLHFHHGPIDLILKADGPYEAVEPAYARAWKRFQTMLDELVEELPLLKLPLADEPPALKGKVALEMLAACWPYRHRYITPMAAVAGAVADEVLEAMLPAIPLSRAMINNGGDIALYLHREEHATFAVMARPDRQERAGTITIRARDPYRGIATSGWRGRSQSLGIADAVTVLARRAVEADAAATMIANAVNAEHPAIRRVPASEVKDDSDLGDLLVTVDVGSLPPEVASEALDNGEAEARRLRGRNLIHGAVLLLQGQIRVIGAAERALKYEALPCH